MSYEITGRMFMGVLEDLSSTELLVLLFLGDFTNTKTGQCNPSQTTLAAKARMTRRAVVAAMNGLEAKGYIVRQMTYRSDGGKAPCSYSVNLDKLPIRKPTHVNDVHIPCELHSHTHVNEGYIPSELDSHTHVNDVHINQEYKPRIEQEKREVAVAPATTKPAKVRFDPLSIELPKAVDREAWHDWVEYKRSSKKPIANQSVATKTANLLARHPPECQQAMVNYSIVGGYPGLYENQAGKLNGQDRRTEHQKRTDEIAEATWGAKANDW